MRGGHYAPQPSHFKSACIALCIHLVPKYVSHLRLFVYRLILPQPDVISFSPLELLFLQDKRGLLALLSTIFTLYSCYSVWLKL